MKTIKERAEEFFGLNDANYDVFDKDVSEKLAYGYITGAQHQHKIDIDKACEWLRLNMPIEYDVEHGIDYDGIDLDEFRKAMEEYV